MCFSLYIPNDSPHHLRIKQLAVSRKNRLYLLSYLFPSSVAYDVLPSGIVVERSTNSGFAADWLAPKRLAIPAIKVIYPEPK